MSQFSGGIACLNMPDFLLSLSKTNDSVALAFCSPSSGQSGSPEHCADAVGAKPKVMTSDRIPASTVVFMVLVILIVLRFNEPLVVERDAEVYLIVGLL